MKKHDFWKRLKTELSGLANELFKCRQLLFFPTFYKTAVNGEMKDWKYFNMQFVETFYVVCGSLQMMMDSPYRDIVNKHVNRLNIPCISDIQQIYYTMLNANNTIHSTISRLRIMLIKQSEDKTPPKSFVGWLQRPCIQLNNALGPISPR